MLNVEPDNLWRRIHWPEMSFDRQLLPRLCLLRLHPQRFDLLLRAIQHPVGISHTLSILSRSYSLFDAVSFLEYLDLDLSSPEPKQTLNTVSLPLAALQLLAKYIGKKFKALTTPNEDMTDALKAERVSYCLSH